MTVNDTAIRPAKCQVVLSNGSTCQYCCSTSLQGSHSIHRAQAHVLRSLSFNTTIWPGDCIEVDVPESIASVIFLALKPRSDSLIAQKSSSLPIWPQPSIIIPIGGKIRIFNSTNHPLTLKCNKHFCQVHSVFQPTTEVDCSLPPPDQTQPSFSKSSPVFSDSIHLDPDKLLPSDIRSKFQCLNKEFDYVFDPKFGALGDFQPIINMGLVPPSQYKGHLPQHSRNMLVNLQQNFDELENCAIC